MIDPWGLHCMNGKADKVCFYLCRVKFFNIGIHQEQVRFRAGLAGQTSQVFEGRRCYRCNGNFFSFSAERRCNQYYLHIQSPLKECFS